MDKLLRLADVMEITQMSRTKIYALIAEGSFPRQRRLSHRCARWSAAEVDAWVRKALSA